MTLCGRHTSRSPGPSVDNAERSDYAREMEEIACEEANFRKFSELKKAREVAVVTIVIIVA